jgi:predicted transposase/invertase (TIGR01784 family)
MGRYLDPKYDFPFKRIFGQHKNLCISLINSMLPFDEDRKVVTIEYETGELIPEIKDLKHSVVDVRCTDNHKRQFLVEMQMNWTDSFKSRVLLNASKAYVRQFDKAQSYRLLHPVYAINFVNDVFEKSPQMKDKYYHHYKIANVRDTEKQIEGLEFIFIELPKFKPDARNTGKLHELWLRFLTEINESTEEVPPELLSDKDVCEAVHYSETGAYNKNQLLAYDKVKMAVLDERSLISDSMEVGLEKGIEKGIEKGMAKGMAKGLEKGRAEGLEKGLTKGREEAMAGIVVNALKKGMSPEEISELTGLSMDEIVRLKDGI